MMFSSKRERHMHISCIIQSISHYCACTNKACATKESRRSLVVSKAELSCLKTGIHQHKDLIYTVTNTLDVAPRIPATTSMASHLYDRGIMIASFLPGRQLHLIHT